MWFRQLFPQCQARQASKTRSSDLSRRSFLVSSWSVCCALLVWPVEMLWAATKTVSIPLASLPGLSQKGGKVSLRVHGKKVLLVRLGETDVRAFNPRCTHKKCTVRFHPDETKLKCKCHNSSFDMDGKVLGGPAPRDLEVFPATLNHDEVIIELPSKKS